jgi:hypothetical protein
MTDLPPNTNENPTALRDDAHLDRAVEPEYAAVSVMAILALILTGVGALAMLPQQAYVGIPGVTYRAPILLVLPVASLLFALAARRKIVRSEGTLVGLRAATAAVALSALFVAGSVALHGYLQHRQYSLNQAILTETQGYLDRLLNEDYESVYREIAANNPGIVSEGLSPTAFGEMIGSLLKQGGDYYGRRLQNQGVTMPEDTTEDGEIRGYVTHRFLFKRGAVDLNFIFAQRDGRWKLMLVKPSMAFEFLPPDAKPKKRFDP